MGRQKRKRIPPVSGWAIYLRTSSEEAQNPENSQRRQRHAIEMSLFKRYKMPVIDEYVDNLSGRYASNRPGYLRMLEDARSGKFSHVAVENAERFGRNDTEALMAIDELDELGIAVRFADYPELDPIDPDDRIVVSLSFTLARRESLKLGQRVRGGLHAKMRSGGFTAKPPDGYINVEQRADENTRAQTGRYTRWIEQDPERAHIWRFAWDMLLEDRYTLDEICHELHKRGYHYRSGRPFIEARQSGKTKANKNTLSAIFHNWFYAGWIVSERVGIQPKTVRGSWEPIVSTEEFEEGLAILARRSKNRSARRRHEYLLKGLLYVQLHGEPELLSLTGSTPNAGRPGGGTPYYCIWSSDINIPCHVVDEQIPHFLNRVQVDPEFLPGIRDAYTEEIAERLGHRKPDEKAELEAALRAIDDEEARMARLFAKGRITESIWDKMWVEWLERRRTLQADIDAFQHRQEVHIANLDAALTIIAKVGILYKNLVAKDQHELLRQMVKRVVVGLEGTILRVELLPPFAYLDELSRRVGGSGEADRKTKTSNDAGQCSDYVLCGRPYGTRTRVSTLKGWHPRPLDEGPVLI